MPIPQPTKVPIEQPTKVPKQPVQVPTKAMDSKIKSSEESDPFSESAAAGTPLCVERTAELEKKCVGLKEAGSGKDSGSVCVEVSGNPPQLDLTYTSSANLTLTQIDFWLGSDVSEMPRKPPDMVESRQAG